MEKPDNAEYKYFPHRGIAEQTFEFYNVLTEFVDNHPRRIAFVYPNKAIKFRDYDEKRFVSEGPMEAAGMFGSDKFDPGSRESITIVEGEYDALAAHEALRGQAAVVSVRSASTAKKSATIDYDYINSFGKIILCLDNDEPGQAAARTLASLFDFNKVYHVKLVKHKDANAYLEAGEADDFVSVWKAAKRYAPEGIINSMGDFAKALKKTREDIIGTYPFDGLQERLYGLARGEVTVFKGLEGIGKTEVFRALEHHLLTTTKSNIGIIHLEEDNGTTLRAIAGYHLNVPATLPDCGVSDADILGTIDTLGGSNGRVNLHSSFDVEDENALLDNVRYLVSAASCDFIFLDHISWLATGSNDEDERRKLDRISQKLKLLCKELQFWLGMISHVNDFGQTRGSRYITKVANTVVDLSRDIRGDNLNLNLIIEKARLGGRTGPAGYAKFNRETGKLGNPTAEDAIRVPAL